MNMIRSYIKVKIARLSFGEWKVGDNDENTHLFWQTTKRKCLANDGFVSKGSSCGATATRYADANNPRDEQNGGEACKIPSRVPLLTKMRHFKEHCWRSI